MYRQYFESLCHEENSFITLTYRPEDCPEALEPKELQLWLKRLRRACEPKKLRFFGVGEYGEESFRPHYHLSLFGAGPFTQIGNTPFTRIVEATWNKGFVLVGDFNEKTANYVTGYVTKKMTRPDDPRLDGRVPEFARMSNRPGIGATAMLTIAKSLTESGHGMDLLERGDIPHELQIGKKKVPLGRYLLHKLREAVGFTDEYIKTVKEAMGHERSQEVLALFQAAILNSSAFSIKEALLEENLGKVQSVEARAKLYQQKRAI